MRTVILLALSASIANADTTNYGRLLNPHQTPADEANALIRQQLKWRWKAIVDAQKTFGTWRIDFHGKKYTGEWVVRHDTWTYFVAGGKRICTLRNATADSAEYLSCGGEDDPHSDGKGRVTIAAAARQPAPTLATLRALALAVFNHDFKMKIDRDIGTGTFEMVVSDEPASKRTSRRFRAAVTYRTDGFEVAPAKLVETFEEQCMSTHGCHAVHWNCFRATPPS